MDIIIKQEIDQLITNNKIIIFMKGNKTSPSCGFSNVVVQIFNTLAIEYKTYNILENQEMRHAIKEYSKWPTIPQVYIDGEFIGGSDIILELYKNKELIEMIEAIKNS